MSKKKVEYLGPLCPEHGGFAKIDGEVRHVTPVKDGEPLNGTEAYLVGPANADGTHDAEQIDTGFKAAEPKPAERSRSGPGYYATDASRASWDRMFGKKTKGSTKAN